MTKAARCWPSERPVRASATNAVTTTSPSSPSSRATTSVIGGPPSRSSGSVSRSESRSPASRRARRSSTRPAAWARWLTADWLIPRRRPASDVGQPLVQRVDDLPAAVGAAFEEAGPQPEHRLQLLSTVVLATDSDPVRHGLGPGDGVAGVQVRRSATGAGVGGQRLLDGPDPDADRPAAGPQQGAERARGWPRRRRAPPAPRRRRCAGRAAPGRGRRRAGRAGPAPRRRASGCPAGPP